MDKVVKINSFTPPPVTFFHVHAGKQQASLLSHPEEEESDGICLSGNNSFSFLFARKSKIFKSDQQIFSEKNARMGRFFFSTHTNGRN
jgi:hypothetical protein